MKLKTAVKIQKATDITLWLVMLPFSICGIVIEGVAKPFRWVVDSLDNTRFRIGNKLLRISDEVRDGIFQNEHCIRCYTAINAYMRLKKETKAMEE